MKNLTSKRQGRSITILRETGTRVGRNNRQDWDKSR